MRYLLLLLVCCALHVEAKENLSYAFDVTPDSTFKNANMRDWVMKWTAARFGKVTLNNDAPANTVSGTAGIPYVSNIFTGRSNTKGTIKFNFSFTYADQVLEYEFTNFEHTGTTTNDFPAYSFFYITTDSIVPPNRIEKSWGPAWEQSVWDDIKTYIDSSVTTWVSNGSRSIKFDPVVYREVVKPAKNHSANALFYTATMWAINTFTVGKIQYADKSEGALLLSGEVPYHSKVFLGNAGTTGRVTFTASIHIKDGRYKYEIGNFVHYGSYSYNQQIRMAPVNFGALTLWSSSPTHVQGSWGYKWESKVWRDIKNQVDEQMRYYIASLKADMEAAKTPPVQQEW